MTTKFKLQKFADTDGNTFWKVYRKSFLFWTAYDEIILKFGSAYWVEKRFSTKEEAEKKIKELDRHFNYRSWKVEEVIFDSAYE